MTAPSKRSEQIRELCVFSMLATLMFVSKLLMEALPNIHLLGMLTVSYTVVYRTRALIPIYLYVLLNGLYAGFNLWWMPYLYIWTILWGVTMLLPRHMTPTVASVVYPLLCAVHGFAFGALYAPAQALMFGMDARQMLAWIVAGLPYDVLHGIGNGVAGLLIYPMTRLLKKLSKIQSA